MPSPDSATLCTYPRRVFLRALASGAAVSGLRAAFAQVPPAVPASPGAADDVAESAAIENDRQRAQAAGIERPLDVDRTDRYLAIGHAPRDFRRRALDLCEGLARDFFSHFRSRGFSPAELKSRLVVVALADRPAFEQFLGPPVHDLVRGIYNLDTNYLVIFDQRTLDQSPLAMRVNSIALYHEATHQLTYNTGLLNRFGDVPDLVSEGLGVYGEVRRPDGRTKIGTPNLDRLELLRQRANQWVPFAELLDNEVFDDPAVQQVAYAQAWVFTHAHLTIRERRKPYRDFLDRIRPRPLSEPRNQPFKDSERLRADRLQLRQDDARATLGDLESVDQLMRQHASRIRG
jgi:hypothetical protein